MKSMKIKFVAYTEESEAESQGGNFRKHIISPLDVSRIPESLTRELPDDPFQQIIWLGVDPEYLDEIVGIFDTYQEAQEALRQRSIWKMNRL